MFRKRKPKANRAASPTASTAPIGVATEELEPGVVVADRYRIESRLGLGGSAVVYRAYDLELEESVALKFLRADVADEEWRRRMKQEIKLARRVVHTNVCSIYDLGSWGDVRFVSMELLTGCTLEHWLEDSPTIDLAERLRLFRGILAGLRTAHELGIVHRDLKPLNIMVSDGRPVIMDFGIAADLKRGGDGTGVGQAIGTPQFMAPERLNGEPVDHRSDLYSLGVILFELATNRLPFVGRTIFEIAKQQLLQKPPRPRDLEPSLPEWLEFMILRLLAKPPEARYQSVDELLADLPAAEIERRRKVLLVDDDPDILALLGSGLDPERVEVLTAEDGARGLAAALEHHPDLICLDLKMPLMDGFDFLHCLKRQAGRERIPVFMITVVKDPQYQRHALRLGIERFFTKPIDAEEVAAQIHDRLRMVV